MNTVAPPMPYRASGSPADRAAFLLVRSPRAGRIAARLLLIFAALTAVTLTFAPWQQSASGTGQSDQSVEKENTQCDRPSSNRDRSRHRIRSESRRQTLRMH